MLCADHIHQYSNGEVGDAFRGIRSIDNILWSPERNISSATLLILSNARTELVALHRNGCVHPYNYNQVSGECCDFCEKPFSEICHRTFFRVLALAELGIRVRRVQNAAQHIQVIQE